MSSPDHDPKVAASEVGGSIPSADDEVINVRHGMFGVDHEGVLRDHFMK